MQHRSFLRTLAPAAAAAALLAATVAHSGLALASSSESFDTSEVALNPQPLPPRDDMVLALNPQPLPPRDDLPVL